MIKIIMSMSLEFRHIDANDDKGDDFLP